jgi:hypothetical protein
MLVPTTGDLAAKSRLAEQVDTIHASPWGGGGQPDTLYGGPGDPSSGSDTGDPDYLDLTLPWVLRLVGGMF